MKIKLQVKQPDGSWAWVADGCLAGHRVITTTSKAKAQPEKTVWFYCSLGHAKAKFPDREFRLAGTREE